MNRKYFSERLKELRRLNKETQNHLANAIYVSVSTLRGYESMEHVPSVDILIAIAKHYNVTVDSLLFKNADSYSKHLENKLLQIRALTCEF